MAELWDIFTDFGSDLLSILAGIVAFCFLVLVLIGEDKEATTHMAEAALIYRAVAWSDSRD